MDEENEEQQNNEEFAYQQALRRERSKKAEKKEEFEAKVAGGLMELIENGHKTIAFALAFLLAVISDFADFFALPALPLVGDALDLFTAGALTIFFWNIGGFVKVKVRLFTWGASLFELLPFGINDVVPTYILGVILAWHIVSKEAKKAEEQLGALEENVGEAANEEFEENESYAS